MRSYQIVLSWRHCFPLPWQGCAGRMLMSAMYIPLVSALKITIALTICGIIIVSFSNVNVLTQKTTTQWGVYIFKISACFCYLMTKYSCTFYQWYSIIPDQLRKHVVLLSSEIEGLLSYFIFEFFWKKWVCVCVKFWKFLNILNVFFFCIVTLGHKLRNNANYLFLIIIAE